MIDAGSQLTAAFGKLMLTRASVYANNTVDGIKNVPEGFMLLLDRLTEKLHINLFSMFF